MSLGESLKGKEEVLLLLSKYQNRSQKSFLSRVRENQSHFLCGKNAEPEQSMSEQQTIKTAIHETAHSILHAEPGQVRDAAAMEVEVESIAYVVCQHYDPDTSEYSLGYLVRWSSNKELPELKSSLQSIRQTGNLRSADSKKTRHKKSSINLSPMSNFKN